MGQNVSLTSGFPGFPGSKWLDMTSVIIDMASRGSVEAPLRISESLEVIDLIISQFISYNNREKYTGLLLLLLSLVFQLQIHKEPSTDPLVAI